MIPQIVRQRMAARPTPSFPDVLLAQVTALMLNAQRYEMRAATYLAMGQDDEASKAFQASDSYAANAFALIDQYMQSPVTTLSPPRTREEALKREFPDAMELRPVNPEMPDATENAEDGFVVNPDGLPISTTNEGKIIDEHNG